MTRQTQRIIKREKKEKGRRVVFMFVANIKSSPQARGVRYSSEALMGMEPHFANIFSGSMVGL